MVTRRRYGEELSVAYQQLFKDHELTLSLSVAGHCGGRGFLWPAEAGAGQPGGRVLVGPRGVGMLERERKTPEILSWNLRPPLRASLT